MRWILVGLVLSAAMLATTLTATCSAEPPSADNATVRNDESDVEAHLSQLKKPWDFAPREQIVSGRDTMSFRKEGTLLAMSSRGIPKVDEATLLQRKYKMYEGRRFHRGLARAVSERRSRRAVAVRRKLAAAATAEVTGDSELGWVTWTLLVVLVTAVLVAWRMGWFVPFSIRQEARKRALTDASRERQSREAKGTRIKLVRRR